MELITKPSAFAAGPNFRGFAPVPGPISRPLLCPPGFEGFGCKPHEETDISGLKYLYTEAPKIHAWHKDMLAINQMQLAAMEPFTPPQMFEVYRNEESKFAGEVRKLAVRHMQAVIGEKRDKAASGQEGLKPVTPIPLIPVKILDKLFASGANEIGLGSESGFPVSDEQLDGEVEAIMANATPLFSPQSCVDLYFERLFKGLKVGDDDDVSVWTPIKAY